MKKLIVVALAMATFIFGNGFLPAQAETGVDGLPDIVAPRN